MKYLVKQILFIITKKNIYLKPITKLINTFLI